MAAVKHDFYDFFCRESHVYPDAEETLAELVSEHVVIGTLSDVAYGMDNQFALGDIKSLMKF